MSTGYDSVFLTGIKYRNTSTGTSLKLPEEFCIHKVCGRLSFVRKQQQVIVFSDHRALRENLPVDNLHHQIHIERACLIVEQKIIKEEAKVL